MDELDPLRTGVRSSEIVGVHRLATSGAEVLALDVRWPNHGFSMLLRLSDRELLYLLSVDGALVVVLDGHVHGARAAVDRLTFYDGAAILGGRAIDVRADPERALAEFLRGG